jgi:voltage-gated potassium channel
MHPFRNFVVTLRALLADESFRAAFAILAVLMLVGTVFYTIVEGWSPLDSLYFAVIAAATVGFGDYAPATDLGKAFTIVYVLIGVGLLVMILSRIAAGMVERRLADTSKRKPRRRRRLRRKTVVTDPVDETTSRQEADR